jgi:hypothetical protein
MLQGFPPVVGPNTHTMILGSFPGEASLDAAQYYAHPRKIGSYNIRNLEAEFIEFTRELDLSHVLGDTSADNARSEKKPDCPQAMQCLRRRRPRWRIC